MRKHTISCLKGLFVPCLAADQGIGFNARSYIEPALNSREECNDFLELLF